MTHDEARELIGAVPEETSPELLAHLQTCPECQAYRHGMVAFNDKLRRALELDWQKVQRTVSGGGPPTGLLYTGGETATAPVPPVPAQPDPNQRAAARASVTVLRQKTRAPVAKQKNPRLFAFAASVAAALLIGSILWLSRPSESLAAEIVTHVEGEPNSWKQTQPLPADKLDAILRKSGVRLGTGMDPVVYASSCWFRGHFVPHVVVTTRDGPVTVMILLHERVRAAQQFNEDGFVGLLVPAPTGSVAVLSRTPMNLEKPAADVVHALQPAN